MTSRRLPGPAVMGQDQVWQVISTQRLKVASLLEQLSPGEWRQPSLCAGWTVKDVAAHLTLQQLGLAGAIAMMASWRGSLDRTIHAAACRRAAAWPTGHITAAIRDTADARRHNIGASYLETLTDILVHGQDIAIPLGRRHNMPLLAAATATSRALSMRWPPPLPAARKAARFRLTATDICWSAGEGPQVTGPIHAILLVCTGRLTALPQLSGQGLHDLSTCLSSPQPL